MPDRSPDVPFSYRAAPLTREKGVGFAAVSNNLAAPFSLVKGEGPGMRVILIDNREP
ncbi:hypothetical protein [Legionella sp. CNM-4043-24]|uniref:hypothetical protein n=1 Tax=Legionella sp. CNM-4043-24 TaxID=3421646 RepID=UPI00403ACA4C